MSSRIDTLWRVEVTRHGPEGYKEDYILDIEGIDGQVGVAEAADLALWIVAGRHAKSGLRVSSPLEKISVIVPDDEAQRTCTGDRWAQRVAVWDDATSAYMVHGEPMKTFPGKEARMYSTLNWI